MGFGDCVGVRGLWVSSLDIIGTADCENVRKRFRVTVSRFLQVLSKRSLYTETLLFKGAHT